MTCSLGPIWDKYYCYFARISRQLLKGTVSRYKRIFSNGSRMGIPNIQLSTWAMWFCDIAIMLLADLALRPQSGVYMYIGIS